MPAIPKRPTNGVDAASSTSPYGLANARVTEVIGAWNNDPSERLMDWAASCGFAWRDIRKTAADTGTEVHKNIEHMFECGMHIVDMTPQDMIFRMGARFARVPDRLRRDVETATAAFIRWASRFNAINPEHIEDKLVDDELRYGGTCDFKGTLDGPRVLLDWKTSKRISVKHKIQLAAYALLHELHRPEEKIDLYGIVRFDKRLGTFEEIYYENLDNEKKMFLSLLDVRKLGQEVRLDVGALAPGVQANAPVAQKEDV